MSFSSALQELRVRQPFWQQALAIPKWGTFTKSFPIKQVTGCALYAITPGTPAHAHASDIVPELIKAALAESILSSTSLIFTQLLISSDLSDIMSSTNSAILDSSKVTLHVILDLQKVGFLKSLKKTAKFVRSAEFDCLATKANRHPFHKQLVNCKMGWQKDDQQKKLVAIHLGSSLIQKGRSRLKHPMFVPFETFSSISTPTVVDRYIAELVFHPHLFLKVLSLLNSEASLRLKHGQSTSKSLWVDLARSI